MAELSKLGRYELRRVLGRGAMGVVYEGFDPNLSRRVAVKTILKNEAVDAATERAYSARFIQEAKAVARLNHPNIVQVYDFGVENEVAYLVMEFIEGRELRSFFAANESFDVGESVRIMGELLDALELAHQAGVIHRDVKPANVMLDAQRRAKLADFGVARISDSAQRSVVDTMVGTPAFMSPEQISGKKIDRRTDIFSAGNILYQLLTGEQPFKGEGAWTVVKAIMQDDPPPPSSIVTNISPIFDGIINRALAKEPEQRFATAREFAAALRSATSKEGPLPAVVVTQKGKPEPRASDTELEFWRAIQNSTDPVELEFYLDQFPGGTYSQLARHKIAKLREPLLKKEAEERAQREAEEAEARRAEEQTRLQAEEKARREAEAKAKQESEERRRREAAEQAARIAEAKTRREAEEKALREELERTKREAAEKAKREAEAKARRERDAQALARLKQKEETAARAKAAVDAAATVASDGGTPMAKLPEPLIPQKKWLAVPAIAVVIVVLAGTAVYLLLGRTPAHMPVVEAPQSSKGPATPAVPAVDVEKIRREREERLRQELAATAVAEKAAMDKALAEKSAAEKSAMEKAALAKTLAEKEAADKAAQKAAAERIAAEKAAAEKSAASKAAAEKAAADQLVLEKAAADKAAAEKAAAEKLAFEKAAEKLAAEWAAANKLAAENAAAEAAGKRAQAGKTATDGGLRPGMLIRSGLTVGQGQARVTIPLPGGDWQVFRAEEQEMRMLNPLDQHMAPVRLDYFLAQRVGTRIAMTMRIEASKDVLPGRVTSLQVNDPCKRTDTLYRNTYDSGGTVVNCLFINHLATYLRSATSGLYLDLRNWMTKEGLVIPSTVLSATFAQSLPNRFLTVTVVVNPAMRDLDAVQTNWKTNPFHRDALSKDAERERYVKEFIAWAEAFKLRIPIVQSASGSSAAAGPVPAFK